ncbi:MAG: DUF1501 domain-containing protein [Gemmataceae bacterium]
MSRRSFLGTTGLASLTGSAWLTPLATQLARASEGPRKNAELAQSVIVLWMQGGPSQLETFDPHPESMHAGGTKSIETAVKGVRLAEGLPLLAEQMQSVSLIRSMVSKEGDHERGTYTVKTGFRPDPTVVHPAIGAIIAHETKVAGTEIPRHISILSSQWPARGGYLSDRLDAFLMDDPAGPVPNTTANSSTTRDRQRMSNLDVVESAFAKGREKQIGSTFHRDTMADARKMMSSDQLKAFDVTREPLAVRKRYGDTPFGRGCLAARRLIEVGVRCVEVTLAGWDTHANNHQFCRQQTAILDPAFAALIADLKERNRLDKTLVVCAGEFGRTPAINPAGGRDHWPTGFSVALAGGGIRGGRVIGQTNPDAVPRDNQNMKLMMNGREEAWRDFVSDPVMVEDLSATILASLGVEYDKLCQTPIGRTVKYSSGRPLSQLLT